LVQFLMPKEAKFYALFEKDVANLVTAAKELVDFFEDYNNVETKVLRFIELEHEGDTITHQIIGQLHRTFVTPFDREDIALLANSLDDFMDCIEGAARTAVLYRVAQSTARARELAAIIVKVTAELDKAIPHLRHRNKFKQIIEHCVEVNRLENEADNVHHAALAELFDNETPIVEVIKWREIYELLECAVDRGEDIANILEGIVIKHA
jgi:predicted phosphate transport protein (TIGR00153 family)